MKKFLRSILTSQNNESSKRFVVFVMALHLIVTSFVTLFFAYSTLIYRPKGSIDPLIFDLLDTILEYDFLIVVSGLGIIGVENVAHMVVEKAKAKAGITTTKNTEEEIKG